MSSAPDLHPAVSTTRLSPVDACRVLAAELFRRERRIENLRTGGLNTEKAVRQRLQSMAMELSRTRGLEDSVALALYAIQWNDEDPLTILEKTEALLERVCRDSLSTPGSLLRIVDRTTGLVARLLILQCLAGRLGRWAVRSGELLDARTARGRYRDLGTPEWSQYCKLTDDANAAFNAGDHRLAAARVFDADRLVRTPASLLLAAVALCRVNDFVGALWTVRTCLLEPEESFENEGAYKKAKTLELRLREMVEGRIGIPLDTDERSLLGIQEETSGREITSVDIVEEEAVTQHDDRWIARHAHVRESRDAAQDRRALLTPKPVIVDRVTREIIRAEDRIQVLPADRSLVTAKAVVTLRDPRLVHRDLEARVTTQPGSVEYSRLVADEKARVVAIEPLDDGVLRLVSESLDIEFPPRLEPEAEEDTYVPVGPSVEVAIEADFEEMTEVPPDQELAARRSDALRGDVVEVPAALVGRVKDLDELTDVALEVPAPRALGRAISRWVVRDRAASKQERIVTERISRRVAANANEVDILSASTLKMGKETRETIIRSLDREEVEIPKGALAATAAVRAEVSQMDEGSGVVSFAQANSIRSTADDRGPVERSEVEGSGVVSSAQANSIRSTERSTGPRRSTESGRVPLTRKHEVTQIVRARLELETDVLTARSPVPKR